MDLLDYNISIDYPELPVEGPMVINTINPHSYCIAKKDPMFRKALQESSMLLPDGAGIVLSSVILRGEKIPRITGSDIHQHLLSEAQRLGLRVFYLGSCHDTLCKLTERINREYPGVTVGCFSPPYKTEFSSEDSEAMIRAVNAFRTDILFVGMTAPKQEKWVAQHVDQLQAQVVASIGAVFDFYAGTIKRPGKMWQKMGLEWLPRLLREPHRLWYRTIVSTPSFLIEVIRIKWGSGVN
jgi:N-acetylglucosaminyldiphosphoundecaprenol N-acetyl-beta-D-mannosaminyltransferase